MGVGSLSSSASASGSGGQASRVAIAFHIVRESRKSGPGGTPERGTRGASAQRHEAAAPMRTGRCEVAHQVNHVGQHRGETSMRAALSRAARISVALATGCRSLEARSRRLTVLVAQEEY